MSSIEDILLASAAEMGNWARHYDTARIQLTALILALSGAAVSYAISTADNRVRLLLLTVTACVGVALSTLSAEYSRLYFERSHAEFQLRKLAVVYQAGTKEARSSFSIHKLTKKTYEAYIEAFHAQVPDVDGLSDEKAAKKLKAAYDDHGVRNWRCYMFPRLVMSFWLWLNLGVGVVLPLACLVFGIRREAISPAD